MKKNTCLILFILVLPFCTFSQEEKPGKPNELDKLYTPDKNSILGMSKASDKGKGFRSSDDLKNIIKFNPALIARSTVALFYERNIADGFSIQGGVGYCYNRDKAQYLLSEGEDVPFSTVTTSLPLGRINKYGTYKGFNPFVAFSLRFHFNGLYSYWYYGSDERNSYIDLGMRFYTNHFDMTTFPNSNERINGDNSISVRNLCYTFTYGYLFQTDTRLVTTHEFYTGFGLRKSTYDKFSSQNINTPLGGYMTEHTKTGVKESILTPMIMVGYVFGFGL